jgi:hypothetical protein
VDMLGRQRRHKGQEWRNEQQRRSPSRGTNHARIIQDVGRWVNQPEVTNRSETGH